ncbi:hypothetical protein [uncultured Dokdonia sp.]|uniref:hypothetical protein n=1 Tax=uncultured Dokdonia sp. TaxID=575653 RepID=UPI0026063D20|nr:hypothetical protein [uncultured Dokdonia sp.]
MKKTTILIFVLSTLISFNSFGQKTEKIENDKSLEICQAYAESFVLEEINATIAIKKIILNHINFKYDDIESEEVNLKVAKYLNENNIVCSTVVGSNDEVTELHLYKRFVKDRYFDFFDEIITDEDYEVDLNKVQIRNGERETLLDYLEKTIIKFKDVPDTLFALNLLKEDLKALGAKLAKDIPEN